MEAAIGNCNFNKAIGVDWFSGKVMKKNNDIKKKLVDVMLKWLNDSCIPDYILVGKAVLFSKTGKEMAGINDTRLITVRTHLLKVLEKAVMTNSRKRAVTCSKLVIIKVGLRKERPHIKTYIGCWKL